MTYIGPYRLLNLIRSSRTAQIWEVIRDSDRKKYALKRLFLGEQQTREEVSLLKHEFEVGRALHHERIIEFYEFTQHKGEVYVVMELFPAPNIKQVLQADGFEALAPRATAIAQQSVEALGYLAGQGWVHRDVKPDNFLLDETGDLKLIDFALAQKKKTGLAKLFAGRNKKVQGTPSYMSPEQIRGQTVDEKADIYSLGCTLYEVVCGKKPYTGSSVNDLLTRHLRGAIPNAEAANSNVSSEFAQLLQRMLAKKPENRPDYDQLAAALRSIPLFKNQPKLAGAPDTDDT
jgi:serine/threonine protein kinase